MLFGRLYSWVPFYQRFTLGSGVCLTLFCPSDEDQTPHEGSSMSLCVCREIACSRKPYYVLDSTDVNEIDFCFMIS
jgi:hypothetical protein